MILNRKNPIRIKIAYPYNRDSYEVCYKKWLKIAHQYKELPPLELVYAAQQGLLKGLKKSVPCILCTNALDGSGIYFPIENDLIVPYACCEECVKDKSNMVLVGAQERNLKYYSWKSVIGAQLADHYYEKALADSNSGITLLYQFEDPNKIYILDKEKEEEKVVIQKEEKENMIDETLFIEYKHYLSYFEGYDIGKVVSESFSFSFEKWRELLPSWLFGAERLSFYLTHSFE